MEVFKEREWQETELHLDALSIDARMVVWRRILSESSWPVPTTLVVEHDARVVGFASVQACRDDDAGPEVGEFSAIYLLSEHWGRGWGRALLEEAVTTLQRARFSAATLCVPQSNTRARRFYEAAVSDHD